MKIKLKQLFLSEYKAGYVCKNKEPRRILTLVRHDNSKTSMSYARYLMSCHIGRFLKPDEFVDHIDNNQLHDSIKNLQILTPKENSSKDKSRTFIRLLCPICNNYFTKEIRQISHKIDKGKNPTCSRSCGGKMSHLTKRSH